MGEGMAMLIETTERIAAHLIVYIRKARTEAIIPLQS